MDTEPKWVLPQVVVALHKELLAEHGGRPGIRSTGLLDSALCRPKNLFYYGRPKPTIPALAAGYAYALTKDHPFVDGNKRVALVVSQLFLKLNARFLLVSDEEKYLTFMKLAGGELSEEFLITWFEEHSKSL